MRQRDRAIRVAQATYLDPETGQYLLHIQGFMMKSQGRRRWVHDWIVLPPGRSLVQAQQLLSQIRGELKRGAYAKAKYAPQEFVIEPTIAELLDRIIAEKKDPIRGKRTDAAIYNITSTARAWLDLFGDLPVSALTATMVDRWWSRWVRQPYSTYYINRARLTLSLVMRKAIALGFRANDPTKAVEPLPKDRKVHRPPITLEDWQRIYQSLVNQDLTAISSPRRPYTGYAAFALTQATLAARGAEIRNLRLDDIVGNAITLRDTKTGPTLTRHAPAELLQVLDNHRQLLSHFGSKGAGASEYVFPNKMGTAGASHFWFARAWRAVMRDIGGSWVPHDLRRLGIAQLYDAGATTREVMEYVGHQTAQAHEVYLRGNQDIMQRAASTSARALTMRDQNTDQATEAATDTEERA